MQDHLASRLTPHDGDLLGFAAGAKRATRYRLQDRELDQPKGVDRLRWLSLRRHRAYSHASRVALSALCRLLTAPGEVRAAARRRCPHRRATQPSASVRRCRRPPTSGNHSCCSSVAAARASWNRARPGPVGVSPHAAKRESRRAARYLFCCSSRARARGAVTSAAPRGRALESDLAPSQSVDQQGQHSCSTSSNIRSMSVVFGTNRAASSRSLPRSPLRSTGVFEVRSGHVVGGTAPAGQGRLTRAG